MPAFVAVLMQPPSAYIAFADPKQVLPAGFPSNSLCPLFSRHAAGCNYLARTTLLAASCRDQNYSPNTNCWGSSFIVELIPSDSPLTPDDSRFVMLLSSNSLANNMPITIFCPKQLAGGVLGS